MDIGDSFENVLDTIIGFVPNLLGFLLILLIGYVIARVVAGVVRKVLEKVGIDQKVQQSDASRYVDAVLPGAGPSGGIARLVFWLVFVFCLVTAIGALQIPTATNFMSQVLAFLPNVIVAILIFVVAALLSGAVAGGVAKVMGDTTTGKVVAAVVPALIMVIAMFMILEQLQIAPEIVRIAFAAVMFAIALALALAFGLGGRDVSARLPEYAHRATRENAATIEDDVARGRDRVHQGVHARGPDAIQHRLPGGDDGNGGDDGDGVQHLRLRQWGPGSRVSQRPGRALTARAAPASLQIDKAGPPRSGLVA